LAERTLGNGYEPSLTKSCTHVGAFTPMTAKSSEVFIHRHSVAIPKGSPRRELSQDIAQTRLSRGRFFLRTIAFKITYAKQVFGKPSAPNPTRRNRQPERKNKELKVRSPEQKTPPKSI